MAESNITIVGDQYAWENKYRPDNIDEVILPAAIKRRLTNYITEGAGKIPSFLFYSPQPGTGKTTTALALCNEIGCRRPCFINASLHSSIDVIRDLVIQYATGASVFGGRKVVILDEVERLSPAAQESLKGVVEKVSANCSFILTTNAKQRVNEPLRSRCREVDFIWSEQEALDVQSHMMKRCVEILESENITFEIPVLASIVKNNFPDNRRIMGILQDNAVNWGTIDTRALAVMTSGELGALIEHMRAKKWGDMKQWVTDNQSYMTEDFYTRFFKFLVPDDAKKPRLVSSEAIPDLVFNCGQAQISHRQVGDVWLHIVYFLTGVMSTVKWSS